MRRLSRIRRNGDAGITLVEMLVAMSLSLVVGALLTTGFVSTHRLFRVTNDEAVGQTDIRTTIERLGRDVRNARSIDAGATDSQLVVWIDSNSNYKKEAAEVVRWQLVTGTEGHFDVTRSVNATSKRTAQFVISSLAFCYKVDDTAPCMVVPVSGLTVAQAATVRVVASDIEYDAYANQAAGSRHTLFIERLRNVA